jgi:hypothetical protein
VLPLTLLLIPVGLYWVCNLIGILDLEFLDVDFDGDADGDDSPGLGVFHGILKMVNATDIPVMIVLSILVILLWTATMVFNQLFNPGGTAGAGALAAGGGLVAAVVLTRVVVTPLKPFFKLLKDDPEGSLPVIGRTGTVRSAQVDGTTGQVEVANPGAPLLLNARTVEGSDPIPRGSEILVVRHDTERDLYFVRSNSDPSHPN